MLTSASECIPWLFFWPSHLPFWSGLCPKSSQMSLSLINALQKSSLAFLQWNETTNCGNQSLIGVCVCVCERMFACAHVYTLHAHSCFKDVCGLISSFCFWMSECHGVLEQRSGFSLLFVGCLVPSDNVSAWFQCPIFATMINYISKVVCMRQHCQPVRAHK